MLYIESVESLKKSLDKLSPFRKSGLINLEPKIHILDHLDSTQTNLVILTNWSPDGAFRAIDVFSPDGLPACPRVSPADASGLG